MNYKDLMPDDLINTETDGYVRVTFATPTSVVYLGGICPIKQAFPISLTEDILVKNRFTLDKSLAEIGMKVYTRPCPSGDLSVKIFQDGSIRFGFIKLTYVHTLQHLLRIAGVQKEIEL